MAPAASKLALSRARGSQRSSPGVEDAMRIERALQRVEQRLAIAVRSPDVDARLQLRRSADDDDVAEERDARSCSTTAACASASPSIADEAGADRRAADQLDRGDVAGPFRRLSRQRTVARCSPAASSRARSRRADPRSLRVRVATARARRRRRGRRATWRRPAAAGSPARSARRRRRQRARSGSRATRSSQSSRSFAACSAAFALLM